LGPYTAGSLIENTPYALQRLQLITWNAVMLARIEPASRVEITVLVSRSINEQETYRSG